MKNKINLNKEINIDIPKLLESRMVILANSGGGKSYAIRKIAEEAVSQVQIIIIDPEGEFASLREKYDFILAGKNSDVPVEVRSASLLAIKLLELGKSAIIDLYELHPTERQRYVKLFFDAMVNCPKELYHPVIIILDEAHEYAPEGKPSEATWAVEALASKGRKRGQCLIPASQRIAKLSKNLSAECNNKLIGRASQDIDMKRAGDELGFSKEKLVHLRQLKPGEFFAFGPAISDEIVKLKIGEVKTRHEKVGYKGANKVPPPSHVIKKVLSELADLPQEAEKEAKTVAEFKAEIKILKTKLTQAPKEKVVQEVIQTKIKEIPILKDSQIEKISKIISDFNVISRIITNGLNKIKENQENQGTVNVYKNEYKHIPKTFNIPIKVPGIMITPKEVDGIEKPLGRCSRAIYSYLAKDPSRIYSKTQVAVAVGYSQNSGGFNNSIYELSAINLLSRENGNLCITNHQIRQDLLVDVDTSLEKWLSKLGACSKKIFQFLLSKYANHQENLHYAKSEIVAATEYSETSGGFNNSIYELSALGLIERLSSGIIKINQEILDL